MFEDFLKEEFSENNLLFWIECEKLKNETPLENVTEKALKIFEEYVSMLSSREVPSVK